jgi:hypothetical protein
MLHMLLPDRLTLSLTFRLINCNKCTFVFRRYCGSNLSQLLSILTDVFYGLHQTLEANSGVVLWNRLCLLPSKFLFKIKLHVYQQILFQILFLLSKWVGSCIQMEGMRSTFQIHSLWRVHIFPGKSQCIMW